MRKSKNYKQKLNKLMAESERIETKVNLDLETAEFMDKEAKKLEAIVDNPNTTYIERESAMKKMEVLYARLQQELNEGDKNILALETHLIKLVDFLKKEANLWTNEI